jgi:hypothetical protein
MSYKSPLAITVLVALLGLFAAGLAAGQFLAIKSKGVPLGPAVRLPQHMAQIVQTTENYLPTLHRNPDSDRFRIELLTISLDDPKQQETFTLLRQQDRSVLQPPTKILGADGNVVWVQALDVFGVDLKTKKILQLADLRKLNPEQDAFFARARFEFTTQLVAVSPDRMQAFAFPADSLRAKPVAPPSGGSSFQSASYDGANLSLCSGGLIGPADWFGALEAKAVNSTFKPGLSLPSDFPVGPKEESRQLYRGRLEAQGKRLQIVAMEPIPNASYRGAALLRSTYGGALLRLNGPDSVLLLHRAGTELFAPLTMSRIAPDGKVIWAGTTGVGKLQQIFVDTRAVVLVGERPRVAGKVPEPVMVFMNTDAGTAQTISLWR